MPKQRSKFRSKLELAAARALIGGLGIFPYRMSLRIGESIGSLVARLFPGLRKTARRNLDIAMPDLSEAGKRKVISGVYRSLGRHLGFVAQFPKFKPEDIRELIEIVGREENFDPAIAEGRGILFFTGHFGSWEVFNLLPGAFGYEMNILVRRIDNPYIEDYVESLRSRFGSVTLGKKDAGRKLYRLLEEGKLLGMLADLNAQLHDGVFVNFFGLPAATTKSIAKIALKTGTVVLPAFAVWDSAKGKYVVHIEPAIDYKITGDREKDIYDLTKRITEKIEEFVRKYPEQWLWIHKRWKTRPRGEKEIY